MPGRGRVWWRNGPQRSARAVDCEKVAGGKPWHGGFFRELRALTVILLSDVCQCRLVLVPSREMGRVGSGERGANWSMEKKDKGGEKEREKNVGWWRRVQSVDEWQWSAGILH